MKSRWPFDCANGAESVALPGVRIRRGSRTFTAELAIMPLDQVMVGPGYLKVCHRHSPR